MSGEAPLLDTTAVLNQTVMTREVLDVLPDTNNVWSIGRLVPAVIQNNIDVGGTGASSNRRPAFMAAEEARRPTT